MARESATRSAQVMGPDEFHSHVDNNAFTNRLGAWHLTHGRPRSTTSCATEHPSPRRGRDGDRPRARPRCDRWRAVAEGSSATADPDQGVIEQFDGYFDRYDVPITEWDENDMPRYPRATTTSTARTPSCSSSPTW